MVTKTVRSMSDLEEIGAIREGEKDEVNRVIQQYSVAVTSELLELIDHADPEDPIALQFLPATRELEVKAREVGDPIGDEANSPVRGIVHRYPDRVLLKVANVCPVYCRFCFRREMIGPGTYSFSDEELKAAIDYIDRNKSIWEVILTGGDPLVLSPRRLQQVGSMLNQVSHVRVVRIHTRVPVVDADRVTAELLSALNEVRSAVYVVLHCNHPRELTTKAVEACATIIDAGIPMLSQSVLLRRINDDVDTLRELFRRLVEARIKPYYLHHGDLAKGTSHFRTSVQNGLDLMRSLRGHISGICQPTYVLDVPGGYGKVPLGPSYVSAPGPNEEYHVTDYRGRTHVYHDID